MREPPYRSSKSAIHSKALHYRQIRFNLTYVEIKNYKQVCSTQRAIPEIRLHVHHIVLKPTTNITGIHSFHSGFFLSFGHATSQLFRQKYGYVCRNVTGLGLAGPLPENLTAVTALRSLDVSNNRLSGQLPAAWGSDTVLQALDYANIANNIIQGSQCFSRILNSVLYIYNKDYAPY